MHSSIAHRLNSLADWRQSVDAAGATLLQWLRSHDLYGDRERALLAALHERMVSDRLLVAFVAEFSRGKSELINAIFFADAGRRVLPATPGRTTMCPVELHHDADEPPSLALLPIETRLRGLSLSDLRGRDEPWTRIPLDMNDPAGLARAMAEVTRTREVDIDDAKALGLWHDDEPEDNPPLTANGRVDVPAWRHAIVNYPHPLLQRGLVVLDTPGLNAIGAEPELTLGLLPSAHATVFLLAADTGVTRSDLSVWREHLASQALERFVVLNKIDTLQDPLAAPEEVERQIEAQCRQTAQTLGIDRSRIYPLSARDGLAARLAGDAAALARSRLPQLEAALSGELLPRQHELLARAAGELLQGVRGSTHRRLADRRRQNAEELLELRGLRGKSSAKVRLMIERVDVEQADFERCAARIAALRAVHAKLLRETVEPLSLDRLRTAVAAMQPASALRLLNVGAAKAFQTLCTQLREALARHVAHAGEMEQMLQATFQQLNAEFGFAFVLGPLPDLQRLQEELALIERNYAGYLSIGQAWRMSGTGAMDQFRRMLMSKLRLVFESATTEVQAWSLAATGQVELQLRERRRAFKRRREALERIQSAAGELEQRISELEEQDRRWRELQAEFDASVSAAEGAVRAQPIPLLRHNAA